MSRMIRLVELPASVTRKLNEQQWKCGHNGCLRGGSILPGDALAVGSDGNSIVHLTCAHIGNAPARFPT